MTDIDPNTDIGIDYRDDGMLVVITLDCACRESRPRL